MSTPQPNPRYRFLHWRYEPERRLLHGVESQVRLKPLLDRLLRHFLDEPGKVLGRDFLIEQVWTRSQVNDEVLSRAVAELRALLSDDARDPRFIETLSKGGYRWVAPVSREEMPQPPDAMHVDQAADRSAPAPRWRHAYVIAAMLGLVLLMAWLGMRRPAHEDPTPAGLALDLLDSRPLATDPRLEFDARFDGAGQVVYIRSELGSNGSELVIVDPRSRAERILWSDPRPLRNPAVSPDGREVALIRRSETGCELWSVVLVDARRRQLAECARVAEGIEWADAGASIIYTGLARDDGHAPGLALVNPASGAQRSLTNPELGEGAHVDPRLSADGTRLAYAAKFDGEGQLWLTDWPNMHRPQALLKRAEPIYGHAFEPDGKALWVAGDLTRYRALHRLVPGQEPVLIGGRGALSIDLAKDGAAVWSDARYDGDIHLQRAGRGDSEVIARSNRYESNPEFSPDGKRIALVSNRNGSEAVLLFDLGDASVLPLALEPRFRWVRPTWSLRDGSLVLTAYEEVQTRLYRYLPDRAVLEPMANVEHGAFHGIELADRLFYLRGHRTRQCTLMQLRAGQAQAEALPFGIVQAYRASGQWLAWRREGSRNLHVAPVPALSPVAEITRTDEGAIEAFTLVGNSLYFVDQGALWKQELPDGKRSKVATALVPDGSTPGLGVSASGDLVVVALRDLSIDLMIAGPSSAAKRTNASVR